MIAINVKSSSGEIEIVKGLLREGINEERIKTIMGTFFLLHFLGRARK